MGFFPSVFIPYVHRGSVITIEIRDQAKELQAADAITCGSAVTYVVFAPSPCDYKRPIDASTRYRQLV